MIGVIFALAAEAEPFLSLADINKQLTLAGKQCCKGSIYGNDFIAVISDIGKVNAASAAQALITRYDIDCLLNIGVAGAVSREHKLYDICAVEKVLQYDFDITEIDDVPLGYIQNLKQSFLYSDKKLYGNLVASLGGSVTVGTADKFCSNAEVKEQLSALGIGMCDMEAGAIAQVAIMNGVPFAAVKCVSDNADDGAAGDFAENLRVCMQRLSGAARRIFDAAAVYTR